MEVRILTGADANTGHLTEFHRTIDRVKNKEELLKHIITKAIMPALKRNWDNSGIKSHSGKAEKAVTEQGAEGNVVVVTNKQATVSYNRASMPYITALIDGRREVVPVNKKMLAWNAQYKENIKLRRYSRPSKKFALYYLVPTDEDAINTAIDEFVASEGIL